MDKFLEKYKLPKLNQEGTENLKRHITSKEIETVIKNLPTNKNLGPDGFTAEFYQKFRGELTSILLKLFQKIAEEVNSQTNSMRPHHHDTKTRQRCHKKRKLQANIIDELRCKSPQQNSSKQNPTTY